MPHLLARLCFRLGVFLLGSRKSIGPILVTDTQHGTFEAWAYVIKQGNYTEIRVHTEQPDQPLH